MIISCSMRDSQKQLWRFLGNQVISRWCLSLLQQTWDVQAAKNKTLLNAKVSHLCKWSVCTLLTSLHSCYWIEHNDHFIFKKKGFIRWILFSTFSFIFVDNKNCLLCLFRCKVMFSWCLFDSVVGVIYRTVVYIRGL